MGYPSVKKGNKIGEVAKRPKPGVPLDVKLVGELITKHGGNLSRVADTLGSQRGVIRGVVDRNPELQEILKHARERLLDELEASCFEDAINDKDTGLRCFLLKTQGKSRGYDQSEAQNAAKDIASAAFAFILEKQPKP